ncbi:Crp/Fnr family transcriptional regulator [Yinghuangia sp. ASG 101]|uniref:Crp/Fnr family transcriptional regulator n=1 Tax=Yinghuangia sp. ASG 101 TaxID=2896848 RepID=UPI001E2E7774|nr:Crp/Fnr family transcriptional regulator [Yinghuangia sp. ASG 101]UGQ13545.1 Crp/Fnr family transcriptional regulator [Yinghuangia sp. ASG 101]
MEQPHLAAELTASEVEAWKSVGRLRRYVNGDALLREGHPAEHALLLTEGRVKVFARSEDGLDVVLAYRESVEVFGEMAVLDGGVHSATVEAIGPVECWSLSPAQFMAYLERYPRLCIALLMVMVHRLREADAQRLRYRARTVVERIAERLLHLSARYGTSSPQGTRLDMRVSLPELAAAAAAARESAVKAVRYLRETGAITTDRSRHFVITDRRLLEEIADGRHFGTGE